jgi:hypothetical protein
MLQTIALVLLLLAGAVFVQTNMPAMQTQIPLIVPGMVDLKLTYLNLMVAMGGMLVLLWIAGLLDAAVLRRRLRQQAATIMSKDQEIARVKAVAYDQQETALADLKGPFDTLAQEIRSLRARIEEALSGRLERVVQTREVTPDASGRTVREEMTVHSER